MSLPSLYAWIISVVNFIFPSSEIHATELHWKAETWSTPIAMTSLMSDFHFSVVLTFYQKDTQRSFWSCSLYFTYHPICHAFHVPPYPLFLDGFWSQLSSFSHCFFGHISKFFFMFPLLFLSDFFLFTWVQTHKTLQAFWSVLWRTEFSFMCTIWISLTSSQKFV